MDYILTSLVIKGDRKAFNTLCRDRYASLLSYARLFLDRSSAEDVVQDVLLGVWQHRDRLDPKSDLQGYLIRSVYNRCMSVLSHSKTVEKFASDYRRKIDSMIIDYLRPEYNPVMMKIYNRELGDRLRKAIEGLPQRCGEVFRMSYIEGMSEKEISERLGISVSTVENHIYMALQRLRATLAVEGQ